MSLHLIFNATGLTACTRRCSSGDKFLLLGDGIYAHAQALEAGIEPANLFLLAPDARARGIGSDLTGTLLRLEYSDFVALTEQCSPIVSWNE